MASQPASLLVWTLGVQLGVDVLIATFFLLLVRSIRLAEGAIWSLAWLSEAIAIGAGFGAALSGIATGPTTPFQNIVLGHALLGLYAAAKACYAFFFARGVRLHVEPAFEPKVSLAGLTGLAVLWGVGFMVLAGRPSALPVEWAVVAVPLIVSGAKALRRESPSRILPWILVGEGTLFLCYLPLMLPLPGIGRPLLPALYASSSLLDAAADLLLALAALLALERARAVHLEQVNRRLEESHEQLRRLVDSDPLTGLRNRRALRDALDAVRGASTAMIVLDIDGFTDVNDRFGHAAGDACLIRLAGELLRAFRPNDHVLRWGGDEFLVVAPGLDRDAARARLDKVQFAIRQRHSGTVPLSVSVGMAWLEVGAKPDEVLRQADEEMYTDKRRRASHTA